MENQLLNSALPDDVNDGANSDSPSDNINEINTSSEKSLTNENDLTSLSRLKHARTLYGQFDNEIDSFNEGLNQEEYRLVDDREISHRIFANRSLHLENIQYYGFDMDYTIAEYKSPQYEKLIFDLAKERIVDLGYPKEISKFEYDPTFAVRGIWFDKLLGNHLKVDSYGNILVCVHGFQFYNVEQVNESYPNKFIQFDDQRVYVLNTLYHLPEMYLQACLINFFSTSPVYFKDGLNGVKSGDLYISYKSIFKDSKDAIDYIHMRVLKQKTIENISYYIEKNKLVPKTFSNISKSGAKIFLLTNSDYNYTDIVMTYLFDFPHGATEEEPHRHWRTYFDIIIVNANKPFFFEEGTLLRQVNTDTGALIVGVHTGQLEKGQVYSGGNVDMFHQLVKCKGKNVLYFGDHIFGDILKSKKNSGWRTFLAVPELIHELYVWTDKCYLFEKLQNLDKLLGDLYKNMDSSSREKPDITKVRNTIRDTVYKMDLSYGMLGSIFRSGSRQTFFSEQVVRYADLYAASFTNLVYYPLSYMFRAPAMLMPHESTVAHAQQMSVETHVVETRQRTSSQETKVRNANIMPNAPVNITHTHDDDCDRLDPIGTDDIMDDLQIHNLCNQSRQKESKTHVILNCGCKKEKK